MAVIWIVIAAGAGLLLLSSMKANAQPVSSCQADGCCSAGPCNPSTCFGIGNAGGILTASEIKDVASQAGFTGEDLNTAVAIALAESVPSGDPNSYNPESGAGAPEGYGSYGLWQIYLNKHQEYATCSPSGTNKDGTPSYGESLYDPQANGNAAFAIYKAAGSNFRPWSTFKNQAYLKHLETAVNA